MEETIEIIETKLWNLFNNTFLTEDGKLAEFRHKVGTFENLQVYIYAQDHRMPHCHVYSKDKQTINAKFSLITGELMEGKIDGKNQRKWNIYFTQNKDFLNNKFKEFQNSQRK